MRKSNQAVANLLMMGIETQHWFRMLSKTDASLKENVLLLWNEAKQIGMIMSTIISNVRKRSI